MPRTEQIGASTASIPKVNIAWIHPFLEILDEVGAPYDEILRRASLPILAIEDGSAIVPTERIYKFVHLAARASRLPDLGLRAGGRIDIDSLLPDAERSWTRPGVFRSLESFINVALESTSNMDMWIESKPDPDRTTELFYLGTFGPDDPAFPTIEQFMVALMVRWTGYGAGPKWNPSQINFRATSVPQAAIRQLAGNASVRCGQSVTSIVFPSQPFLGRMGQFPEPTSEIWKRHRESVKQDSSAEDMVGSLRLLLKAYLPDGSPDIQFAARLSGTTVRTLQRRLREQGLTYTQLLEGLRHDLAIYLLRDSTTAAATVSQQLGYRDPAIFTRAFRRWTGTTPSKFRRSISVS